MDPAKLKVVELRAELQARGLDTKGNKPVLVKRLKEALEAELQTDLPDTSIADTSTEDFGSQDDDCMVEPAPKPAQAEPAVLETNVLQGGDANIPMLQDNKPDSQVHEVVQDSPKESEPAVIAESTVPQIVEVTEPIQEETTEVEAEKDEVKDEQTLLPEPEIPPLQEPMVQDEPKAEDVPPEIVEQNGDSANGDAEEESCEPKAKKSRWGSDSEVAGETTAETEAAVTTTENEAIACAQLDEAAPKEKTEERGDKRKHSSPSPERNQRQRSKSPIREDEPVVDANKVQLSWYDSDLHLQIDKTNFLSAKPLNEGLFGYIWSGARVTHGVKSNKACYEVKITEELQFEDILSSFDRRDNRRDRRESKREDRERSRAKSENGSESTEKSTVENETKSEVPAINTDDSAEQKADETIDAKAEEELDEASKDAAQTDVPAQPASECEPSTVEEKTPLEPDAPLVKVASHLIRIGWSSAKSSLQLGEDRLSYGLESSGKFYANSTVLSTDATFKTGDVVRAFVDMTQRELVFAINGTVAFKHQIAQSEDDNLDDVALFPHVLTRNMAYEVNTGDSEEAFSETPEGYTDYVFVSKLDGSIDGPRTPAQREDCEVIMMCGLPGAGKTHWVKEYIQSAPKTYNLIGSSFLLDRMTVEGNSIRACVPAERLPFFWNKLQKSISRLCEIAPLRRRDFILDQTNVFPTAIRRKMRSFLGFKRHAVIVVNEDEEQEKRMKQQDPETGKDMSMSALLEMKANMGLPKVGENLEQATYASLPEDKAHEQVQKYNKQGRDGGFGNIGHHRRDYRDDRNNRWHQRGGTGGGGGGGPRREYQHRNNYRDRPYQNNRYDRNYRQGSAGGNWRPGGGGGGGGAGNWMSRNDRRDNRSPRDWRPNNRSAGTSDRPQNRGDGNRDHRSHGNSSGGNYNRNRNQSSGGGRWGGGQSGGGWSNQGGGSWNSGGQSQDWNSGWNQSQGSWNQNQWKYGGGYNQGGYSQYPQNWNNYYSGSNNYSQDWSGGSNAGAHGQGGASAQVTSPTTNTSSNSNNSSSYASSSIMAPQQQQQQAAWAQYAQHYTQGTTSNSNSQK